MARYIVLRIESNQTAELLLERFAVVPAIRVVGLFASPTKFCDGTCPNEGKSVRSKRWGLWFCPICKQPKKSIMQSPKNLLEEPGLHPKFADFFISVWEPFMGKPREKYGDEAIDRTRAQVDQAAERISRSKRRRRRKEQSDG